MKLQNEETGQVENFCIDKDKICSCDRAFVYDSLAQLQEAGWQDYEEPKEKYNYYYLDCDGKIYCYCDTLEDTKDYREIGNYFETQEEAEKAVEKLRAWKRLKDNGFKFTGCYDDNTIDFVVNDLSSQTEEDLGLLFWSEE